MSFDIVWTKQFKWWKKPLGYHRLLKARKDYGTRIKTVNPFKWGRFFLREPGYQEKLRKLRDLHEGKRCFIIGNGPSLNKMDLSKLRDEITIGSNGMYRLFPRLGFTTTYLTMEDIAQCEDRSFEIRNIKGPIKVFALHNAYCVPADEETIFMNVHLHQEGEQKFSRDCSAVAFLGSTITFINLQLAFHLGCNPVYLIGVDFNYGRIEERLTPGKVVITPEVYKEVQQTHFDPKYHTLGNRFGVPHTDKQYAAFRAAREAYEADGRIVLNAGVDSRLDIFNRIDYASLFEEENLQEEKPALMSPNDELAVLLGSRRRGEKWKRLYDKALLQAGKRHRRKALALLLRSIACKPNIPAYYLAGIMSKELGNMDHAVEAFEKVLQNRGPRLDSKIYSGAHFHLGEVNYRLRNLIEAKFHFERCLAIDPCHNKAADNIEMIKAEYSNDPFAMGNVEIMAP